MAKRKQRNELVAGAFILAAAALAVAVLLTLADWRSLTESKKRIRVIFSGQSVKDLTTGSPVKYNGLLVGKVRRIDFDYNQPSRIEVILEVPRDLNLYANASLYIGTTALGGSPWIQIDNAGAAAGLVIETDGPDKLPTPVYLPAQALITTQPDPRIRPAAVPLADDAGHPIYGGESPNQLIADMGKALGFGAEQRTQLQATIQSISSAAATLDGMVRQVQSSMMPKVDDALTSVQRMTDSGAKLVGTMNAKVPPTLDRIDNTVADLHDLLEKQSPVVADTLKKLNNLSGTLDAGSRQQLENVQAAMKQLGDALAKAADAADNLRQFTGTARDLLNTNRDGLNDTFVNLREASEQMAAGMGEIRREPWRLFYTPKPGEENASNVMEAARDYARGASRLRDASTRLGELVKAKGEQLKPDDPHYRELLKDLDESQTRFDKAERALYQLLKVK